MTLSRKPRVIIAAALGMAAAIVLFNSIGSDRSSPSESVAPIASESQTGDAIEDLSTGASRTRESSLEEVLQIARDSRAFIAKNLHDYTARFIKQEVDTGGTLGEKTEMQVKVQTRFREDGETGAMRVYMNFISPESVAGREVIWAEDLHDAQLVVHEAGLLGIATLRLPPTGFLAMRGQRYPISEFGLVRLVEKLIERGELDLESPDIEVTLTTNFLHDDVAAELIQVKRGKPSGRKDDFSMAEIVVDRERQLILQYRSFGWPKSEGETLPLQESYAYHDIKINVGLTDKDFDPENDDYRFP